MQGDVGVKYLLEQDQDRSCYRGAEYAVSMTRDTNRTAVLGLGPGSRAGQKERGSGSCTAPRSELELCRPAFLQRVGKLEKLSPLWKAGLIGTSESFSRGSFASRSHFEAWYGSGTTRPNEGVSGQSEMGRNIAIITVIMLHRSIYRTCQGQPWLMLKLYHIIFYWNSNILLTPSRLPCRVERGRRVCKPKAHALLHIIWRMPSVYPNVIIVMIQAESPALPS